MSQSNISGVRGWCPGALKPMESGDGLIVRLRARAGMLAADELLAIAGIAQRYGNGLIDLTRRANLQIRGVKPEGLTDLLSDLSMLGLLDNGARAESVRNVMVSPLSGIDPTEVCDLRAIARELEHRLCNDPALWELPGKFGFIVDGGGLLPLDDERADIRIKGIRVGDETRVALAIDGPKGTAWLGVAHLSAAVDAAICIAHVFLKARGPDVRSRMRDVPQPARSRLQAAAAADLSPANLQPRPHQQPPPLGVLDHEGTVIAAGIAAPFGRIEAEALRALASTAIDLGITGFRPSPWRSFYADVSDKQAAYTLSSAAEAQSFIVDAADPLLAIDACPGAPSCGSTSLDTRAVARRLAPLLRELGCRCAHVSGCAKGCARSKSADLVLVGDGDRFGVMRNDTAQAKPLAFVLPARLSQLPTILAAK